ncbi:MAG: hypothetical protein EOP48_32145, partial [Sphingobacteriales bacterium]
MNNELSRSDSNNDKEESSFNIQEVLGKYVYHWPVFVFSLFVCVSAAYLYLRYTKPIYEVTSTLLLKDDKKGGPSEDILSQLDLAGGSKVVENEIEVLRSKTLMAAVVKPSSPHAFSRDRARVNLAPTVRSDAPHERIHVA